MRSSRRTLLTTVLPAMILTLGLSHVGAGPKIRLEPRTRIVLQARALSPDAERSSRPAERLELDREGQGELELTTEWPEAGSPVTIRLFARVEPEPVDGGQIVALRARSTLADGREATAARTLRFDGRATALFEVYRQSGRSLTLAIEAELVVDSVLTTRPTIGSPVRFKIDVARVLGDRAVTLESNYLNTFVGEAVTYAFRLGEAATTDAVQVKLTPRRLLGAIAEIDVEVSGALPGDEQLHVMSRHERWMATRGTTSTVDFVTGEPPSGYRFLITARF